MNVQELITELRQMPPMMEVYLQGSQTALERVESVHKDTALGIVELHYEK